MRSPLLAVAVGLLLVSCSSSDATGTVETTDPSPALSTTTASTTETTTEQPTKMTVPSATTTVAVLSAEDAATLIAAVGEWNSGETDRWRATFTEDAVQTFGQTVPVDAFQVQHEFFAVLNEQLVLGECASFGDRLRCEATSTNRFHDLLLPEPMASSHTFGLDSGLIASYSATYNGVGEVRSAWLEMRDPVLTVGADGAVTVAFD